MTGKVWHKGLQFAAEVVPFVPHMSLVDEHRESLLRLQGVWDSLALLGQMSGAATDMGNTRSAFHALTGTLLDSLARSQLDIALQHLRGKAQVAIDILVRNLFERTADVGFLAADRPLRAHVSLCGSADDSGAQVASRAALEARFRAYVAKYSVYDDIVVLSSQGRVLARLDPSVAIVTCDDALIAEALRPGVPFVEHYGISTVLGQRRGLIYATAIVTPEGATGVLCLSFRLKDEMRGVFRQLLLPGDRTVLVLRDAQGHVLLSSDPWQVPVGAELQIDNARSQLVFAGRDYLAVAVDASGYEGYRGPGWSALALLPVDHAFDAADESGAPPAFAALAASLDTRELFAAELRAIPVEAGRIQNDLSCSLWNGKLRSRTRTEGGDFAATLLNEVERTGQQLRQVFEQAIGNLQNTALNAVFDEVVFHARLAIDIVDRNLYERANDVRWWALDSTLQQALHKAAQGDAVSAKQEAEGVLRRINGLYTVYALLLVFDVTGEVIAVSDPAQSGHVGRTLDQPWVAEALALRDRERYIVSRHAASGLYGEDGTTPTYVYATALQEPDGSSGIVGGIAIVFDGAAQFAAMLRDALPQRHLATGLLVTRDGRVVSSTDGLRWPVGGAAPLPVDMLNLNAGESRRCEWVIDGIVHAVGLTLSSGYREYRLGAARSDEDVLALVMQPLGPRLAGEQVVEAPFIPPRRALRSGGRRLDVASFTVDGQAMGVPAEQVLEALQSPRLMALPNASQALIGMVNHEERMLPVLDLGLLLGNAACAAGAPVIVCQCRVGGGVQQRMALRVPTLGQVFSIAEEDAQTSPAKVGWAGHSRLVRGDAGTGMLTLFEVEALWAQISGVPLATDRLTAD